MSHKKNYYGALEMNLKTCAKGKKWRFYIMQPQSGGKFRPRLNTGKRSIANKYREGKMKRTLKRESKSA